MNAYQLLGSQASYYTGKARAYLRYKNIDFEEIAASAEVFEKIIVPRTGVRFIPVLISPDDQVVQDTTEIIDFLEERFPEPSIYPQTPKQRLTSLLLELYGDEWLVIPAMYYRWWFTEENFDFILREFGKTAHPELSEDEQREAAKSRAKYFAGALPNLGISEKNHKQIEAWYERFLDCFSEHLKTYDFLLGSRPSIGDYGLIGPLYAHLSRDPYPAKLMRKRAPLVKQWVDRMHDPQPLSGEFLADDMVPETLNPILSMMFEEHFPVLIDSVEKLHQWRIDHPDKAISRVIGTHSFSIGGATEDRLIFPYTQWMFQRPLDYYTTVPADQKQDVDIWLKKIGGYDGMQTSIPSRVQRIQNILKFENE